MTAEFHGRLDGDGVQFDATGERRDHVTLLAAYAKYVAEAEGSTAAAVLERAKSRQTRLNRYDEELVVIQGGDGL